MADEACGILHNPVETNLPQMDAGWLARFLRDHLCPAGAQCMATPSQREPRLTVAHLLLWTLGCALGFTAYRGLVFDPNPRFQAVFVGYNLAMGIAFGTILTGSGLLVWRRWQGNASYPLLPGHWLLLFGLAAALANGVAIIVYDYRARQDPSFMPKTAFLAQFREADVPSTPGFLHQTVGWGLGAAAALGFSWHLHRRLRRSWVLVFLTAFVTCATVSGGRAISMVRWLVWNRRVEYFAWCRLSVQLYAGFMLLGAMAILAALAWDIRCRARTDALHRLGIAVWLGIIVVQIFTYYVYFHL